MTAYVALVRAVNVGGRSLAMRVLREACEAAGATDVATYIQSGNVVLRHPKRSGEAVGTAISAAIANASGIDTPVMVRSAGQLARVVAGNPFAGGDNTKVHVIFCAQAPPAGALSSLDLDAVAPEELAVVGTEIYLRLPNGVGRGRLPIALGKVKALPAGTMRNWNTTTKLLAMVQKL